MKTEPFSALKKAHETAVERFARKQAVAFERRALWLVQQIKKELPEIQELVFCNGEHWFEPADAKVPFVDKSGGITGKAGKTYPESLCHVLNSQFMGGDLPAVSPNCLAHLRELYDLTSYSEESQLPTLNVVTVVLPPR